jgi:two-component system sensor histidine kinase KdpD
MRWQRLTTVWGGYPFALAAVAIVTAALLPFRPLLHPAQVMLLYLPAIVGVARFAGVRVSVAAAALGFLALDFVFVPPYYHLTVASPADWVTLVVFLLVAAVAGMQTGFMRQRERAALQRQAEFALLHRLSSRLVSEASEQTTAGLIVGEIVSVLGADRAALYAREAGESHVLAQAGGAGSGLEERVLADWVTRNAKAIGLPSLPDASLEPRPAGVAAGAAVPGVVADGVYLPLQTQDSLEGALYARPLAGRLFSPDTMRLLIAVSNLAAAFLQRRRLGGEAARAVALRDADRLKTTLISSVSHELKTPLAAVTARITGLLEEGDGCDPARVRDELGAVSEDLGRLDSSIRDLLDFSRLESDSWRPRLDDYDVSEVLGTVSSRIPAAQRARVVFEVPEGLPTIRVDFAQWARALSNLIDNALLYSPTDELVHVGARVLGRDVLVWVDDRGPGVPDAEKEQVFEKFYRGPASSASPSGTGLGLAIAHEIARAHGGRVWVEDARPSGARFVISLPLGGEAA